MALLAATETLGMIDRDEDAHRDKRLDASVQQLERFLEIPGTKHRASWMVCLGGYVRRP
jgi:hypothetical protein